MDEAPSAFTVPWWLKSAHLQTVAPLLDRGHREVPLELVRTELPDGDFLDVHWLGRRRAGPLLILLPGMQGTFRSSYIRQLVTELSQRGMRAAVLCHRGSTVPNRLAGFYHAGFTEHLTWLIQHLRVTEPETPLFAVGFSLGGSMLVQYLAQAGTAAGLRAAAAVSLSFDLKSTARLGNTGLNRVYQGRVLRSYARAIRAKAHHPEIGARLHALRSLRSIETFDDTFTAPLHGFPSADAYYARCSSGQHLGRIALPFLILNAADDPLVDRTTLPRRTRLPSHVHLELTRHGGHLGFLCHQPSGLGYYPPSLLIRFFSKGQLPYHEPLSTNVVADDLRPQEAADANRRAREHAAPSGSAQRSGPEPAHEQRSVPHDL